MKITDIKLTELKKIGPVVIANGLQPMYLEFILMTVCTDEGYEGHCYNWYYSMEQMAGFLPRMKKFAVGRDPRELKKITYDLGVDFMSTDIPMSVLDICLYDLVGQIHGMPIYELLGGKVKDKMPVYVSTMCYPTVEEYVERARKAQADHFKGYKIHTSPSPEMDIEVCRAVRKACPDMALMIDACGGYTMADALRVGKVVEELNFEWYESPLADDNIDGMKALRSKLSIPISYGENIRSIARECGKFISAMPGDVLRTFGDFHGGITMLERVAHVADAFDIKFDPHSYGPTLVQAAHFQVMLAHKSSWWLELPIDLDIFNVGMKDVLLPDESGYVHAPTKPGLGVELDWDYINANTVRSI